MFDAPTDAAHLALALAQARTSAREGGIPIGAALVHASGRVLSVGHNCRVQRGSNILHAEMACLENWGRPADRDGGVRVLRECTMYTTLSPCIMCAATCVLYRIPRVVLGENATFVGGEDLLRARGVEVVNLDSAECRAMMAAWIAGAGRTVWWEDIGLAPDEAPAATNAGEGAREVQADADGKAGAAGV